MEELDFAEERAYYALTRKAFDFLAPVYDLLTWPLARIRQQAVTFANPPIGGDFLSEKRPRPMASLSDLYNCFSVCS
jgi:hypothetical protein